MTRVLAYNILVGGTRRIDQIEQMIEAAQPDVPFTVISPRPPNTLFSVRTAAGGIGNAGFRSIRRGEQGMEFMARLVKAALLAKQAGEPFLERDLGLPPEELLRLRDVRLARSRRLNSLFPAAIPFDACAPDRR